MVITIDGPSGVGKSTVSRSVAERLGLAYLDTGATYRAATLAIVRAGVDVSSERAIQDELSEHSIDYAELGILLDGESVAFDVRSEEVTSNVSVVSAHPKVRSGIVAMQRRWVESRDGRAVVEGRDIGTVVFPDAPVKIYLTARPVVRARRRARDPESSGKTLDAIAAAIESRDHADSTRSASPLRPAEDATVIDTSDLSVDQVVEQILTEVASRTSFNLGDEPT